VLIVGAIPIVSTARILQANAIRNERAHADSALRGELQSALRDLGSLGDDASARAGRLAQSEEVQRALIGGRRGDLRRLAARHPGFAFVLHGRRVAGPSKRAALERPVALLANGHKVGEVIKPVTLDQNLAHRLTRDAPHADGDRLVIIHASYEIGTRHRLVIDGKTVETADDRYRSVVARVPGVEGVRLVALRSENAIKSAVGPYQRRIRFAEIGSFALLILVALLFAGPILRLLGDFRRIASQAATDSLTGLANRRMFDEELALEWRRADRVGDSLALILLDLDDFKNVNDTHGHQAGDAVLRQVGEVLGAAVRQVDLAGRYGGEEFAVIVPETDLEGAVQLAERLRVDLSRARIEIPGGEPLEISASFGVAVKGELASAEELIAAADEALYDAKGAGKNRVSPEASSDGGLDGEPERLRASTEAAGRQRALEAPLDFSCMRVSAKVDYAVRAGAELAAAAGEGPLKGDRIAQAQEIPLKFLENILLDLKHAGIVQSQRGAEGGYWLARPADEISLADVIRAVEGPIANVRGLRPEQVEYGGAAEQLRNAWIAVRANLRAVLETVTLADLAAKRLPDEVAAIAADPDAWQPH
jgi:Rrf2 family protein